MLRIGVAGLGVMGRNHLRVLRSLAGVEVAAVCDPVTGQDCGVPWYSDAGVMAEAEELDAAVVAVPTPLHTEVCLPLLRKKVSLLVEKPAAADAGEAQRLRDTIAETGVKVAVGHVERFNPVVQALRRELAEHTIYSLSFTRVGHMPPRIADVGVLSDLAVHDIDLLRFITAKSVVSATVYSSRRTHDHNEDCANVLFELDDHILATVTTNWLTPFKRRRIEVTTAEGYFEADLIAQELAEYSAYKDDDTHLTRQCAVHKGEPLANELQAFVHYLTTGERGDLADIDDSVATLRMLESPPRGPHPDSEGLSR